MTIRALRPTSAKSAYCRYSAFWAAAVVLVAAANAFGQAASRTSSIGFVYPAGAQQGTTVQVIAGGQGLRGVTSAVISPADAIEARVVQHYRPVRNLDKEQRNELLRRFNAARAIRLAESRGETPPAAASPDDSVKLPPHPFLDNLESMTLRELDHAKILFINAGKRQPNAQIAELVLLEIAIAPSATPGKRQLRLLTPNGFTNPIEFRVGALPETREYEPNDPATTTDAPPPPPLELPVTINGQAMPGDVDRFQINARKGQRLVFETEARSLVPYLADAVPGWFQAVVALYDAAGREIAFADDFRFDPDPVLFFDVPQDGAYTLEIRDSIYRGREDFVYRISVGELPFITSIFPLGGCEGGEVAASVAGWNLPASRLTLDTAPGEAFRQAALTKGDVPSNSVLYAVDSLPECAEAEPNGNEKPQPVAMPCIVNGRVNRGGDVDVFEIQAAAGDQLVAEVTARRLNSPLDSILRLTDASGRVLAWNDDLDQKGSGLLTHHADSYLAATLAEAGTYRLSLADTQQRGGDEFAYRLRLSAPRPDFELRSTPSSLGLVTHGTMPMTIYALRKDGFDGEIELVLKEPAHGFSISGGRIPTGRDHVRITLTAPNRPTGPVALCIVGRARINSETVAREAAPADDTMQAFAYQHLVPAADFLAAVGGKKPWPPVRLTGTLPVRIALGESASIAVQTPPNPRLADVELRLNEPPEGIELGEITPSDVGLTLEIKAGETAKPGLVDNLIVDVYMKPPPNAKPGQAPTRAGSLPAIPLEIAPK